MASPPASDAVSVSEPREESIHDSAAPPASDADSVSELRGAHPIEIEEAGNDFVAGLGRFLRTSLKGLRRTSQLLGSLSWLSAVARCVISGFSAPAISPMSIGV